MSAPTLASLVARREGARVGSKEMAPVVEAIFQAMLEGGEAMLAFMDFSPIRAEDCSPPLLAVALRGSFTRRGILPTWDAGLATCVAACELRGYDVQDMLGGLM